MKKNVYTKAILRQPVYSLILAFLLMIATFGFVLRSVEFITVRQQIFSISGYFQSIGFLRGTSAFDDVSEGANFLDNSPYIGIADRRRVVEGVLQDVLNSAIADPFWQGGRGDARRELHASIFGIEVQEGPKDVIFYGELIAKFQSRRDPEQWTLTLNVGDVLIGYPEYAVAGQSELQIAINVEEGNEFVLDSLEIGERYLLRTTLIGTPSGEMPRVGDSRNEFIMQPLYPDGAWYRHIPHGETVDLLNPELAAIVNEIEVLHHPHHTVQLRTTRDLALVPMMLEEGIGFMVEGRAIDYDDYVNANPVAVIHRQFARIRDLNVGDTLTIEIPQSHTVEQMNTDVFTLMALSGIQVGDRQSFIDVHVESIPLAESIHEIELEIVGIYNIFEWSGGDPFTNFSTRIYIPDSVLPDDVIISSERWESLDGENYLPSFWYTFQLENSRDELAFLMENRQPLAEMGLTLIMAVDAANAQNFWQSANIILQATAFNAIVFSFVLILVLLLVAFLFLRQRRKELTIDRMLGYSTRQSVERMLKTTTLFIIPTIIGAVLAWLFARRTIMDTLVTLEELVEGYGAGLAFTLSPIWLIVLIAVVFVLVLLMVLIGAVRLVHRPLLELLQGK